MVHCPRGGDLAYNVTTPAVDEFGTPIETRIEDPFDITWRFRTEPRPLEAPFARFQQLRGAFVRIHWQPLRGAEAYRLVLRQAGMVRTLRTRSTRPHVVLPPRSRSRVSVAGVDDAGRVGPSARIVLPQPEEPLQRAGGTQRLLKDSRPIVVSRYCFSRHRR